MITLWLPSFGCHVNWFSLGMLLPTMKLPIPLPYGDSREETENVPSPKIAIPKLSRELRRRIRASDNGRATGWIVEFQGEPVAVFDDCRYADMFWESYRVTLLTQNETIVARMQSRRFFDEPEICFRSREFPDIPLPFQPLVHFKMGDERAVVRGLYFVIDPPTPTPPTFWKRLFWWRQSGED